MSVKNDYDRYFDLTREQKALVQRLLIHEYLNTNLKDSEIVYEMVKDMQIYEMHEKYETCQLYKDALDLLDDTK